MPMRQFLCPALVAVILGLCASQTVDVQGTKHVQMVSVLHSGLATGQETFLLCSGKANDGEITATAQGYAVGPTASEDLWFDTAPGAATITSVECVAD